MGKSFFNELASYALFIEGDLRDQIALYAIYSRQLQDEFADFVKLWNGHPIRTQKNHQHVISGIPMDLYRTDGVRNWGIALSDNENAPDCQALRTMLDPLRDIDIDSFLTPATEAWCTSQLEEIGFDQLQNDDRPFLNTYVELRERIHNHLESHLEPALELSPFPTGGIEQYVRIRILLLSYVN